MQTLIQDIRYALRLLAKNPAFASVVILILGLGIGASSALFSFVSALVIRPMAIGDASRVVRIFERKTTGERPGVALPNFLDWQAQNQVFEGLAAFRLENYNYADQGDPDRIVALRTTAGIFTVLDAKTSLGRPFTSDEDRPGGERVAVLTRDFWQRRYQSDPNVIGRRVRINGDSYTVIGVLASDPEYFKEGYVWVPLASDEKTSPRGSHFLTAVGLLKPGVTLAQAQAGMDTIARGLSADYAENRNLGVLLMLFQDSFLEVIRAALMVGMGAAVFLLLIACANVGNIVLARVLARTKEIAIRMSVGASRTRIIRQLVTESVVLSLLGGLLGLLIATWSIGPIEDMSPQRYHIIDITIDARVLGFALVASLVTGILFGVVPALQISRGLRGRHRLRNTLVISEVALAVVLLIGAGLLIQSYFRLQNVDPGLDARNLLTMRMSLPPAQYPNHADVTEFYNRAVEELRQVPGVESTAAAFVIPVGPANFTALTIEGAATPPPGEFHGMADYEAITPGYFHTLRIPVMKGRDFTDHDSETSTPVVMVNESIARRYWPSEEALGRRIRLGLPEWNEPWRTVVGMVKDVKTHGLDAEVPLEVYVPFKQSPNRAMAVFVRTAAEPAAVAPAVRSKMREIDRDQPLFNVRTMQEIIDDSLWQRRGTTLIIGIFSVVALILSGLGLYGVIAYSVHQRWREMGIRMALGARGRDLVTLVLREGMMLTAIGMTIGVAIAFGVTRVLSGFLFGVSSTDAVTFAMIALLLLTVAFVASYLPARRATKVDPLLALRHE